MGPPTMRSPNEMIILFFSHFILPLSMFLGFSTGAADYYLVNPSEVFKSTIADLIRKVFVTKLVVERLLEAGDTMENLEYEDLLRALESRNVPGQESSPISADDLIKYSDFVVAQVQEIKLSCFRFCGVNFRLQLS